MLDKAQSLVYIILPPSTAYPAPHLWSHLIDTDLQRHSWLRSTNGYWSTERMTIITVFDAWLKVLHIAICK